MSLHALLTAGYEIGTGRTVPTIAAVLGLISVVVAGRAFSRRAAAGSRRAAAAALVLGSIGAIVGGIHAVNAAGGLGTGNGLAGAVAALALGVLGAALAGLALTRGRRRAPNGQSV